MTEPADEQVERERKAVLSLKGAKANMEIVLDRVATLERALFSAQSSLKALKSFIPPNAYPYSSQKSCAEAADDAIAAIAKVLP